MTAQEQASATEARNRALDLIRPVAERYRDFDTAAFAIGDFIDRLHAEGLVIAPAPAPASPSATSR
jgi:hypothetical protein